MYLKKIFTYIFLSSIAFIGFFGNVSTEYTSNQNSYSFVNYTHAAEGSGSTNSKDLAEGYNKLIDSVNMTLSVISAFVSPIILFVGWLMSPDWTAGDIFGLRPYMYKLWIVVSNIVYFVYAILLILIALGTMFGQEKFSYKVILPKLALGILMVPFTWWFVQWTVSVASIITASVITIPDETLAAFDEINNDKWFYNKPSIPKKILVSAVNGNVPAVSTQIDSCSQSPDNCITPRQFLKENSGMYGPLVVYAYSVFKFQDIKSLKVNSGADLIKMGLQVVNNLFVSAIMFLIFGLLIMALMTILLVRAMKLWIYAIFSPLFTFRFVAGSNLLGGDEDTFSIKEFIGLAFVPAIISLVLSFGLIMVSAVQGPIGGAGGGQKQCDQNTKDGCVLSQLMGSDKNTISRYNSGSEDNKTTVTDFKWGLMSFQFEGALNETDTASASAISAFGGMFGTIIVQSIALVFIWVSFMAAKNVSKAVKVAAQPFEEIGNKIGGMAKKLPQYTPLPIPGGSIKGLGKMVDTAVQIPEAKANAKLEKNEFYKFLKNQAGMGGSPGDKNKVVSAAQTGDISTIKEVLKNNNANQAAGLASDIAKTENIKIDQLRQGMDASIKEEDLKKLIQAIKEGKDTDGESLKLAAILSGARKDDIDTKTKAEKWLENQYKTNKTGSDNKNSGATGAEENKKNNSGANNNQNSANTDAGTDKNKTP